RQPRGLGRPVRCDHGPALVLRARGVAKGHRAGGEAVNRVTLLRAPIAAGFVLLRRALCRLGVVSPTVMIPPSAMAVHLWKLLASGRVNADIVETLGNVAAAFALSVTVGFASGAIIHSLPRLRRAIDPFLATYY